MNVLVTGGCGFIGQHVVHRLKKDFVGPINIWVVDKQTDASTGWDSVQSAINTKLVKEDVCNVTAMRKLFGAVDFSLVLHLAAQSHVDESLDAPDETMYVNAVGTQVIASMCSDNSVPLVYCSTDEVYGPADIKDGKPTRKSTSDLLKPSSPYSAGKAAGELAVRAAGRSFGLQYAITRGCNAFGSGQYTEKLVPIACSMLQSGDKVPLHGGGSQIRQWVHVDEFANAIIAVGMGLLQKPEAVCGQTYNIAGPRICSVEELVDSLASVVKRKKGYKSTTVDRPGQDEAYAVCGKSMYDEFLIKPSRDILDQHELKKLLSEYKGAHVHVASFIKQKNTEPSCAI